MNIGYRLKILLLGIVCIPVLVSSPGLLSFAGNSSHDFVTSNPSVTPNSSSTENPPAANVAGLPFLSVSGATIYEGDRPWRMKGFNYLPRNSRFSPMSDWNWEQVERDMRLAAGLGSNTVRTFVHFTDDDPHGLQTAALSTFLELADRNGMRVIVSLFENMPGYDLIDARNYARGYRYLRQVTAPFKADPRIAAWDLLNEGDRLAVTYSETTTLGRVLDFYSAMSAEMRRIVPHHLLTAGFASVEKAALSEPFVDVISFHSYGDAFGFTDRVSLMLAELSRPLPVLVTETGAPSAGNPWSSTRTQLATLADQLETIFTDERLSGALVWQLTDYVARASESAPTEPFFGVLSIDSREKPAAQLVRRYFAENCGGEPGSKRPQRWLLRMSNGLQQPPSHDRRYFSGAYRAIRFLNAAGKVVSERKAGSTAFDQSVGKGWYAAESWGRWAKQEASMYLPVPVGATQVEVAVSAYLANAELELLVNGQSLGSQPVSQVSASTSVVPRFLLPVLVSVPVSVPAGYANALSATSHTRPPVVTGLRSEREGLGTVRLAWNPAGPNLCYEVYRGSQLYAMTTSAHLRMIGLRPGSLSRWLVRAVSAAGQRSTASGAHTVFLPPQARPQWLQTVRIASFNGADGRDRTLVMWESIPEAYAYELTYSRDRRFAAGPHTVRAKTVAPYVIWDREELSGKKYAHLKLVAINRNGQRSQPLIIDL